LLLHPSDRLACLAQQHADQAVAASPNAVPTAVCCAVLANFLASRLQCPTLAVDLLHCSCNSLQTGYNMSTLKKLPVCCAVLCCAVLCCAPLMTITNGLKASIIDGECRICTEPLVQPLKNHFFAPSQSSKPSTCLISHFLPTDSQVQSCPCRGGCHQAPAVQGDPQGVWVCCSGDHAGGVLPGRSLGSWQCHSLRPLCAHAAHWLLHRPHRGPHLC